MPRRNLLIIFVVALVSLFCYQRAERNPYARYVAHAMQLINRDALDEVPPQILFDGAMDGMVSKLDRFSAYISAKDAEIFEQELQQEFGGVGVRFDMKGDNQSPTVIEVLLGTPAAKGGLRVGDQILKIDGIATSTMSTDSIVQRMRGAPGSELELVVARENQAEPITLQLTRAVIVQPSVLGDRPLPGGQWDFRLEQDPRIGYIRVTQFGEKTVAELTRALAKLQDEKVQALVLDLRNNSGGLLEAATGTCDLFLPGDLPIVSIKGRGGELEREYHTSGSATFLGPPIAILINGDTASASEIVAACLQDHGRAVVIGERSYGKGTVQHVHRIESGKSILKLTAASYWRPSGENINRGKDAKDSDDWGIMPDENLEVKLTKEQRTELQEARSRRDLLHINPPQEGEAPAELHDPQLERAVEVLQEDLVQQQSRPRAA